MEERERKLKESLRQGKKVGKGIFRTRLNWGFWALAVGFALYALTKWVILPIIRGG